MSSLLTSDRPAFLATAGLVLDLSGLTLRGPSGETTLTAGPYLVLKALMRRPGVIVPVRDLIEASWPDPALEPTDAERAVRVRVARARQAMVAVGVSARKLRSIREMGYRLAGPTTIVRVYTPAQAAEIDRMIAAHPAFQSDGMAA